MPNLKRFTDYDSDIRGRWSEKYLEQAVLWGLLQGDEAGTLRPKDPITREELAVITYRLLLSEPASATITRQMESLVLVTTETGLGSGFWLRDWLLVTNAHVVHDRDKTPRGRIEVWGHPGTGFSPVEPTSAAILAVSHADDLTILQAEAPGYMFDRTPPPVELSDRDPAWGQEVWALGHPYAESWDVSRGIIRHPQRFINAWEIGQQVLALDVPINPGNSGGMLINAKGRIVGVPSAGRVGVNSMTYAVPVSRVKRLEEQL